MKPALLVFGLAAFALSLAPAAAQVPLAGATPTAEDLVSRSKAAQDSDRRPDDEREVWGVRLAGLDGTLDMTRHGDDMVTETALGPFRTARGVWHGQHWHQNENGETVLDRPEPSQTERPVSQSVARVHDPVDAWLLTTTFSSGHVLRLYYDPKTYYVLRSEKTVAGHTTHTAYDDFRTDARGRTRFWHYYGGDDRPDNDFDYRLQSDDTTAEISEADVAVPHDRRTLVEFPAGVDIVRLPARIENDRVYVRLEIEGRGLDFLLDTGSSSITINDAVARDLRLPLYGHTTQTVAGSFVTGRVVAPAIAIGGLTMHDVVLHTLPLASAEAHDTRVVGLLGFDFLDAVALKIDYTGGTVDAIRPGALAPPPGGAPLDVRLNSGAPVTHASVGDASGDDFILDTGAAFSFVLFQRFARAHPEAFTEPDDAKTEFGSGVGGTMPYRTISAKRVALGPLNFDDDRGAEALSPNALGFDNEDGLIGADILKLFTVYLDYGSSRVYLVPSARQQMLEAAGEGSSGSAAQRGPGEGAPGGTHSPSPTGGPEASREGAKHR